MKCNKCNSDIDKYSKFCPNCGNEIIKKEDDIMYRMKKNFYKLLIFLTLLCLIVLAIVDVSRMVIEKNKLNNINNIAIWYYSNHKEDDDVTERIISLVKRNDENIINVRINKDKNTIYLDKKIV